MSEGGDNLAHVSWGLKKPCRIWFKLNTKYDGRCSNVTDCARTSIVFSNAAAVGRAAALLLQHKSTVGYKNRFAVKTPEGYADMLFTIDIDGYICELQIQ